MLFDDSANIYAHSGLFDRGTLGDAYRQAILKCIELISLEACDAASFTTVPSRTVIDLGVRAINSLSASALLMHAGYWVAAGHQMRDLIEVSQLIELIENDPSCAEDWVGCTGKERYRRYSFGKVKAKLDALRPERAGSREMFDFWSNIGSHPSVEGLALQQYRTGGPVIGPTTNFDHMRLLYADLFRLLIIVTYAFISAVESLRPEKVSSRHSWWSRQLRGRGVCLSTNQNS